MPAVGWTVAVAGAAVNGWRDERGAERGLVFFKTAVQTVGADGCAL
jgi:hypothetical protein